MSGWRSLMFRYKILAILISRQTIWLLAINLMQQDRNEVGPAQGTDLSCSWIQPNPHTIQFSDKKHNDMFKPFNHQDSVKLDEIGHTFQLEILAAVKEAAEAAARDAGPSEGSLSLSLENRVFLSRMTAFVSEVPKWSTRDAETRMARLDWMKIDLLYITDLQNLFSEYLQHYVSILQRDNVEHPTAIDGGPNGPFSHENVRLIILTLRLMISQAQNCAFFGCLQSILQITTRHTKFTSWPVSFRREQIAIYEQLTVIVEILFQHMYNQKKPFQMLFSSQEKWDTNFKRVATDFQEYCNSVIKNFSGLTQLMIYKNGAGAPEHLKALQEQEGCDLAGHLAKLPQQCDLLVSDSLEDIRECFRLHAFTMSLLMGQYFDLVKQQKVMFERHMDPAKAVQNLILIIGSPDPYFDPRVRVSAIKVLEFLCELDAHPEFRYSDERNNPYFEVILKSFQEYVSISKRFAEFYSPGNLAKFTQEQEQQDEASMQVDESKSVITTENAQRPPGADAFVGQSANYNVFSSQMFLRAFLSFMYTLVSMRTRSMQTQLYPQLIEPILKIITVMPRNNSYILNLDCQKQALQVLKEITRSNIFFDDEGHVVLLIDRLKVELAILRDDYDNYRVMDTFEPQTLTWLPFKHDDSFVHLSHTMAKRQDLIGSFLRFLCYSIVRMDPNQISINQNFVAHSRKILESNIFEECLRELVFDRNPSKESTEDKTRYEKVIDPIYMTCVQLYSYVFNDLATKVEEYIGNGLLPCIVESLSRRIPRQKDFVVLTCKFMRLLLFKPEGTKLVLGSRILANLQEMALSHESYNELCSMQQNREYMTLFSQLAAESQELSDQMLATNISNLWRVIDLSWELTAGYLESEKINAQPDQTAEQREERKDLQAERQSEFEHVVENVCNMLLFQVHEIYEGVVEQRADSNVRRSIDKQTDMIDVIKKVITTPTICSAASNFLIIFANIATLIMVIKGREQFKEYIEWLGNLLRNQIASLKTILNVDQFHHFDPKDIKKVVAQETPAIVESDPDKLELLFRTYKLSGEDLVWVTVAKIHAYMDLLLICETDSRQIKTFNKECVDFFLQPEISRSENCLRTDVFLLSELLRRFQHCKFCEKFQKKIGRKQDILARYREKIQLVDWAEFTTILEPHNDYEQALNLYYTFEYAQADSFKLGDATEIRNKFRIVLNPGDDDVPESSQCKKKCLFFVNRVSYIYRREKPFDFRGENTEMRRYSEESANVCLSIMTSLAERCQRHLAQVQKGEQDLTEGVDMELINIKLQMAPLMQELCQWLVSNNKISKSAPTAFLVSTLLEKGVLTHIFTILDWAVQILLAYDSDNGKKKLLLHQQVLHESLLAPMNLLSVLVCGEFLKRGELHHYLQPKEMSANVAILRLRLFMMSNLVHPMVEFFLGNKAHQFLLIADKYDHDFSKLLEGVYCVLCANAFFGPGSAFDPESLKQIRSMVEKRDPAQLKQLNPLEDGATPSQTQQLIEMGFEAHDVVNALSGNRHDFERALDQLCRLRDMRDSTNRADAQNQAVSEEVKQVAQSASVTATAQQDVKKKEQAQESKGTEAVERSAFETVEENEMREETGANNPDFQVGNIQEAEAAFELEFRQRRKLIIKTVAESLIWILPNHLTRASCLERERIFMNFLVQMKKEDDAEIQEALKKEILAMINKLLNHMSQQASGDTSDAIEKLDEGTGVDWILINLLKWSMASDQLSLPPELTLGGLGSTLTDQFQRIISRLSPLTRYEKPDLKDLASLTDAEKRKKEMEDAATVRKIQCALFNIFHYVKIISVTCDQLKSFQSLQNLQQMISEASRTPQKPDEKLNQIVIELQHQFKLSGSNYFQEREDPKEQQSSLMQIDTTEARQAEKSNLFNLQIDQDKAGTHLQAYFSCFLHFFKELSQVSGSFHESFSDQLNKIFNKALRCLGLMAQIGQIGSFDFTKAFMQKNFLKVLLQAKVLDTKFVIDTDVWRSSKKPESMLLASLETRERLDRIQHHESLCMFRALVREVTTPKKEQQKRLEVSLKRQLYKQFLQNFRRGEQIDFYEYLQTLQSANSKRREDSPGAQRNPAHLNKDLLADTPSGIASQQRAKTKGKAGVAQNKAIFSKPAAKTSNRAKSEEKLTATVQQGSHSQSRRAGPANQPGQARAAPQNQCVPNKLLKKLIVKYDEYNQSNLEDFISFNKVALDDQFTHQNLSMLQACSRVAVIKSVEAEETEQSTKVSVNVKDEKITTEADIMQMLNVNGKVKELSKVDEKTYVAEFAEARSQAKAIKMVTLTMSLRGQVHSIEFKEAPKEETKTDQKPKDKPKEKLMIMLKRQVLKEMIYDPDFNQPQNYQIYGHGNTAQDLKNVATSIMPTKTQTEMVNQMLEILIEQARGLKMDTLKIIRNPLAFLKQDRDEPVFVANDTVLKIVPQSEEEKCKDDKAKASQPQPKLVIDEKESTSVSKQYFLDYSAIMNGLVEILDKQASACELVLKHNDGKTLRFLLRNIFYIMSVHIDGQQDNQVAFKNMQSYNSQKLSDRLQIVLTFLSRLTTITKSSTLKQQMVIQEIQRILVSLMSKNLVNSNQQRPSAAKPSSPLSDTCIQLADSARLVAQYNTVWIMTQHLFNKPHQNSISRPEDAIVSQAIKLDEQVKLHIVKLVLLETQKANSQHNQLQTVPSSASDLAFMSHIKKLLDNLEASKFLFTAKAKVPCMHMCIWAVTSVLKIFENRPELFIQLSGGAPPPPSDSEMDDEESQHQESNRAESRCQHQHGIAEPREISMSGTCLEVQSEQNDAANAGLGAPVSSQPVAASVQSEIAEAANESENEEDDEDDDDDEEEGEEDISESDSYGSMDIMEGNEDLSSNRDLSMDQDMLGDDHGDGLDEADDGFDGDDSYDSEDYGDEDSSALIEIVPRVAVQNFARVKGNANGGSMNDNSASAEDISNSRNFEVLYAVNEGQGSQPAEDGTYALVAEDGRPQGAVNNEEESYYSHEEQESYEPPLSYDQENDSVLSFESHDDQNHYYDAMGGGHMDGPHNDMDAYDDIDNASADDSISDEDSQNGGLNHHHHHHHPHDRMIHHPMSLAHMPLHSQLWHQVNIIEADPLETKVISLITSLNSILDSVSVQKWPYQTYISGISGANAQQQAALPLQDQQQTSSKILRDEQGDEVVKFDNPELFKDDKQPEQADQPESKAGIANAPPQKSALDIEGMDPLFLETVGPQGLQNIADSHQIQNTVVNSANMISRDRDNHCRYETLLQGIRQGSNQQQLQGLQHTQCELQSRIQTANQMLGSLQQNLGAAPQGGQLQQAMPSNEQALAAPAQQAQPDGQAQSNEAAGRGRFMSVDTVAVSMLGPNDASRQLNNQAAQNNDNAAGQVAVNYPARGAAEKDKVQIRGSQFMQNVFNDLQDLIAKFQKNTQVSQVDKQCQEIIKTHLLPQDSDSAEEKFKKIHDSMQIALIGFKIFNRDDLQIQSRIRLLFRIPSLRICLILRVLKLITGEVNNLIEHRDECSRSKEFAPYKSSEKMPYQVERDEQIILHEMPLDKTIMVSLIILEQLQECLQTLGMSQAATQQSIEIAKVIKSDELLSKFASLSGLDVSNHEFSIIETVMVSLQRYFDTVTRDPWVLPLEKSKQTQKTALYNSVLASFKKILQPLSKVANLTLPVQRICDLVVAPSFVKLTKLGHQNARKILNDFKQKAAEDRNLALIGGYMESRLEVSLKAIIDSLQAKKCQLEQQETSQPSHMADLRINPEQLLLRLDETKEILKLSSGIQKIKNQNICRQDTLANLFTLSNTILAKEQKRADTSTKTQQPAAATQASPTSNAFMYRSDIKEMILLLFALCEYNLRIVFNTGGQLQESQTGADVTMTLTSQSPVKDHCKTKDEQQKLAAATSQMIDTTDQEMLCTEQEEIYKMIERQIAVQQETTAAATVNANQSQEQENKQEQNQQATSLSSQQRFQLDKRLKTIIGFFISNKKLINVFIRVNQQVVNVQLKNLVVKIPQILEFDTKRLIWRIMLKKTKQKVKGGQWEILVRRDQAFDDSFGLMRGAKAEDWKVPLRITFQDEQGVDEGGLTKEWFTLLSKHMFNEDMALFLRASQGSTYFPNPKSIVQADHLELFEFIGKFVGKALMDQQLLECYFVKAFYKLILEMPLDYSDLEDYDQELHKSLTWILQNEGAEHLCSYFVDTQDYFGESKNTDLCEGGSERLVTDENKEEYVKLVANYRLKQEISKQMDAFKSGLFSVVPKDLIKIFDNRELELLISGLQVVDIDDLRENTQYQGYTANSKPVQIFWEALRDFDNSERAEFIQFVTGSSKVPVEGFKGLRGQNGVQKFTIAQINSSDRLPQSHTCVNQLDLPQYKDKETMTRMLLTASKEGKTFTIA